MKRYHLLPLFFIAMLLAPATWAQEPTPGPVAPQVASDPDLMLTPPRGEGPVLVRAAFALRDLNDIDDSAETFQFSGTLRLVWRDPRQAFDPQQAGVKEKLYQGEDQLNGRYPAWYPQIVLANESGLYEKRGVLLRAQADGTQLLYESINASAETYLQLRRLPFDSQTLEAAFEVLGMDTSEVLFEIEADTRARDVDDLRMPQWEVLSVTTRESQRDAPGLGPGRKISQLVLAIDVERQSLFLLRLIVVPLALIVALSWVVFWMDRASIGDRISVSFVGILTAVAYQIVIADLMPNVSEVTLMHAFLNISFLVMCSSVVVTLVVGACDAAGQTHRGDLIDRRARWLSPLTYVGLLLLSGILSRVLP